MVEMGASGAAVGRSLARVREAYLDGEVVNREEGLALAREIVRRSREPSRQPASVEPQRPDRACTMSFRSLACMVASAREAGDAGGTEMTESDTEPTGVTLATQDSAAESWRGSRSVRARECGVRGQAARIRRASRLASASDSAE